MPTDLLTRPHAQHTSVLPGTADRPLTATRPAGLEWLDVLRIVAIVAVVVIHAVGAATRESGTGWHTAWWWAADLLNSACLWCVPIFVMVSGALLLDPARQQPGPAFLRRRAVRIGVPLVFWTAAYLVFQRQFYGKDLTVAAAVKAVASGDPYLQLYFLFIVAGLTALTPVLRRLVAHSSRRELVALTVAALGFGLAEHAVRSLGGGGGYNAITRFLPYVGYYLAGHLLRTMQLGDRSKQLARRLAIAGWLATALGSAALSARYGWTGNGCFLYDYLSPTVMATSLAVFVWARTAQPRPLSGPRLRRYGAATFGVFLIHPVVLFPVLRALALPDTQDIGRTVAWSVPIACGVCVVTGVLTLALTRVPVLRRLVT